MAATQSEQRHSRRVAAEMPIRYKVIGGEGGLAPYQHSKTTNISVSGVAFVSRLRMPIDCRLELDLTLPDEAGHLQCEATVMRIVRELPGDEGIEYGLQFDEKTVRDPGLIEKFIKSIDIVPWLAEMLKRGATDLHLTANTPPMLRINRQLVPGLKEPLSKEVVERLVLGTLSSERRETLRRKREVNFPFPLPGVGHWRVSVFYQRGHVEGTFHAIDLYVPTIAELGLPGVLENLAMGGGGLIAVTGHASSGRSTTIAAMLRHINQNSEKVIITIENPIQYVHENLRSVVKQREVGTDTPSVQDALHSVLRQDPDVIVVDDVPDAEAMDMILRAAETGRLVFATFSTEDMVQTIRKVLGMYAAERRVAVLHSLSNALRGVISQRLLPSLDGTGLVLAPEVVTLNSAIRQAIWTNKLEQIPNLIASSPGSIGLDASLRNLILRGRIDYERASQIARDPEALRRNIAV